MGTTLTGTTPQDTYDSLIKVTDNGPISGTAKYLSDGLGNDSVLALSTSRVGVGTNAPSYDLTLSKSVAAGNVVLQIENTSTTGSARLWFGNNANAAGARIQYFGATHAQRPNLFSIGTDAANDVVFETSGSERMRITSAGNVGIGISAPTEKLSVAGNVFMGGTNANIYIDNGGVGGAALVVGVAGSTNGFVKTDGNFPILIQPNNTTRVRIDSDGLKFNADTAAANALDDYEEGTFTPNVVGSSTAGTATYVVRNGKYTKIGNQVSFTIYVDWNSGTGVGNFEITGLPFTVSAGSNFASANIGYVYDFTISASSVLTAYCVVASTRISFKEYPLGGGTNTDAAYDANGGIIVSGTYFV